METNSKSKQGEGTASIAKTTRIANIRLINNEISFFVNDYGQRTPILIVAMCKLDDREYAALYDISTGKRYSVEIVKVKGEIKEFRDLDGDTQDEEWAVVSNFFLKQKVFEKYRIDGWVQNTMLRQKLSLGKAPILQTRMRKV
jgi:hypothetical protein